MRFLHSAEPSNAPKPPPGVVQMPVQFVGPGATGKSSPPLEAARLEWFLQGTQQRSFAMDSGTQGRSGRESPGKQLARITSPKNGTIIALDPDIPAEHQRVYFLAQGNRLRWIMDRKVFASGTTVKWLPWPGRHVVQIVDAQGQVLDEVMIEVRGAGVRTTAKVASIFRTP
jgi:penicillin-binding protein 1C